MTINGGKGTLVKRLPRVSRHTLAKWRSMYLSEFKDDKIMKVRKLDARNKLHGSFKYQITLDVETFLNVRDWCQETWGPAVEYQWWGDWGQKRNNVKWSFDTQRVVGYTFRSIVYLQGDAELTLFQLKWA